MDRLSEESRLGLMVMRVFIDFPNILLRLLIKGLPASGRAEIIDLSLVFRCTGGSGGVNIHVANGIMHSSCHTLVSFGWDYATIVRPGEAQGGV